MHVSCEEYACPHVVLCSVSFNENIVAIKRTDYTYWIMMKPIICNTHIMSSSMRIQSIFYVMMIFVSVNYNIVCSIRIKCKPHIMKLTTSYLQVMGWSVSKKVKASSSEILISQICNL